LAKGYPEKFLPRVERERGYIIPAVEEHMGVVVWEMVIFYEDGPELSTGRESRGEF